MLVRHYLGGLLLLDATQCGSYAYQLHNWWTNLAPLSVLQLVLRYTIRDLTLQVSHILDDQSMPTSYKARETSLVSCKHNRKTQEVLGPPLSLSQEHTPFKEMDHAWYIVMLQPLGMNQAQKERERVWGSKLALLITPR
jgi:hypothetical protein